ncbi:hypothetical protein [Streptacidiphilus melanogenes]|uniref:hypothetical protein n=1 Tax=Streptacidiphilus melanogenes TaxID=411235 RepID=UPI0005AAC8F4|nr:hypothetical protein [Streptacidiphilus melanogenes]
MAPDSASAHEADSASTSAFETEKAVEAAPEAVVVVQAHNDAGRIALTVLTARALPGVRAVLVLESGSTDSTRRVAADSGAVLLTDASQLAGYAPLPLLFVDPGRQQRVPEALVLLAPVAAGSADAAVATATESDRGDAAARLARRGLTRAGLTLPGVLTGEYCLSSTAWSLSWPPAAGAGALPGVVVDLLRAGRVVVPIALEAPRPLPGRGLKGRRQVAKALRARRGMPRA